MRVRSIMISLGIQDLLTRTRVVRRGMVDLQGRAWTGEGRITRVEVSGDGGRNWIPAKVGEPVCPYAWQPWRCLWDASSSGAYDLCCRAPDTAANAQPLEQCWTARGMGPNPIHHLSVLVVE